MPGTVELSPERREKQNKQNAPAESKASFCGGVFGKRPAGEDSFLPGGAAGTLPALGYAHQVGAAGVVFVVAAGAVVTADVGLGLAGRVVHRGVGTLWALLWCILMESRQQHPPLL